MKYDLSSPPVVADIVTKLEGAHEVTAVIRDESPCRWETDHLVMCCSQDNQELSALKSAEMVEVLPVATVESFCFRGIIIVKDLMRWKNINMDNLYNKSSVLTLNRFNVPPEAVFPAFLFATLSYMIILFCNLILILTIALNKSLHQPMYLILLNLPVNDLVGSSAVFMQVIKEILTNSKTMQYSACVAQAFFIHIYAGGAVFILTAMAYDRYIAICCPLKYNTVMTNAHVMSIITALWMSNVALTGVLFFLLLRLPRCRSELAHPYCDNPSLLSLVCADTTINNIYGLLSVGLTQVIANGMILYTYLQILVACFRSKQSDTKAKALQTCATHLSVFLLLECLGLFTIISYRIRNISPHLRQFMGMSTLIFPPTLNPIIYGLKTKEIRLPMRVWSLVEGIFDHS
uniref:olfactory receptor 52K2-like n=1 Tax=Scatophagus argus TaxID=75038 RepID=UPI001ED861C8